MCTELTNTTMYGKITIALIGAIIALILREIIVRYNLRSRRKQLAALCVEHLKQIHEDLIEHVQIRGGNAYFGETQYCEIVVGDFLYDLITSNIEAFPNIRSLQKTIKFFHHYKVNMSTVRSRLDVSQTPSVHVTEGTYNNLLNYLKDAIGELNSIAQPNIAFKLLAKLARTPQKAWRLLMRRWASKTGI